MIKKVPVKVLALDLDILHAIARRVLARLARSLFLSATHVGKIRELYPRILEQGLMLVER